MAGDFNHPVVTDGYTNVLAYVRDLCADIAKGLDGTGTSNIPTDALRWNSTNKRFEKYNGTSWAALESTYAINVDQVDGYHAGNSAGQIPVSNGTLCSTLNADKLDGYDASAFLPVSGGTISGGLSVTGGFNSSYGIGSSAAYINLGQSRTADGYAYIDLIGDTTYTDYGLRLLRNSGANGGSGIYNRGTGALTIACEDAAEIHITATSGIIVTGPTHITGSTYGYLALKGEDTTDAYVSILDFINTTDNKLWRVEYSGSTEDVNFAYYNGSSWTSWMIFDVSASQVVFNKAISCAGYIASATTFAASSSMTVAGSTVWHAGNDGSGSGLDADTLDTYHASTFMRLLYTSGAHTWVTSSYWTHSTDLSSAKLFLIKLVCLTAEHGYAVGDVIYLPSNSNVWTVHISVSSGYAVVYSGTAFKALSSSTTPSEVSLTPANWSAYLLALG